MTDVQNGLMENLGLCNIRATTAHIKIVATFCNKLTRVITVRPPVAQAFASPVVVDCSLAGHFRRDSPAAAESLDKEARLAVAPRRAAVAGPGAKQ